MHTNRTIYLTESDDFARIVSGGDYMSITATELKTNLSKYILLAATEDIYITQYGKVVAKLTSPFETRVETAESLFGILPQNKTPEEAREERSREV